MTTMGVFRKTVSYFLIYHTVQDTHCGRFWAVCNTEMWVLCRTFKVDWFAAKLAYVLAQLISLATQVSFIKGQGIHTDFSVISVYY